MSDMVKNIKSHRIGRRMYDEISQAVSEKMDEELKKADTRSTTDVAIDELMDTETKGKLAELLSQVRPEMVSSFRQVYTLGYVEGICNRMRFEKEFVGGCKE